MQGKILDLPGRQWRFECHSLWRLRTQRRLRRIRKVLERTQHLTAAPVRLPCVRVQWMDWSERGLQGMQSIIDTLQLCRIDEIIIHLQSSPSDGMAGSTTQGKVLAMEQLVQIPTQRLTLAENWKDDLRPRDVQRIMSSMQRSPYYHDLMITHWGTDMETLKTFCQSKMRGSLVLHMGNDILDQLVYLLRYGRLLSLRVTINRRYDDIDNNNNNNRDNHHNSSLVAQELEQALATNTTLESLEICMRHPEASHSVVCAVFAALKKNRTLKRLKMDHPLPNVDCLVDALPYMHGIQEIVAPWPVVTHVDELYPTVPSDRLVAALQRNTSLTNWDATNLHPSTFRRRRPHEMMMMNLPRSVTTILRRNLFLQRVQRLQRFGMSNNNSSGGGGGGDGELLPWLLYCSGEAGLSARYLLLGKYFTAQLE
mmetsp:Transcript_3600/g.7185  ORF Transcript_3600/g.7185 Transcript_3600/m.7185 type:complete len:425 (-) Transcript_3600:162-1436(-)